MGLGLSAFRLAGRPRIEAKHDLKGDGEVLKGRVVCWVSGFVVSSIC